MTPSSVFLPALYVRLAVARVRGQMRYRVGFLLMILGVFVANAFEFVALLVLFGQVKVLGGWSAHEVALLWGMSQMSFAIAEAFGRGFEGLAPQVRSGEFDQVLVRPLPVFFQVFASAFEAHRIGRFLQGATAVWYARSDPASIPWQASHWTTLIFAVTTGAVIFFATFVLGGAWALRVVDGQELMNTFTYGGTTLASYPLELFSDPIRRAATWILPLAFVNYFPALALLGRVGPPGMLPFGLTPIILAMSAPVVAMTYLGVAVVVWDRSVMRYQGTGT
ncbi:MAG: ABC transporter permease [Chloroflexi bacterium]|nr:ABC transporter permease [Chloroflexota bacterium]